MASSSQDTRFHHYIPQFLLRNFSHPGQFSSRKKGKGKRNGKPRRAEDMLNAINLSDDKAELMEIPVKRTFGIQDLYIDPKHQHNIQHIEELLGLLEGRAARVINKIRDRFEKLSPATNNQVTLTREEKDTLRKFLFVMRYRRLNIKQDHDMETIDDYGGPDKEELAAYMQKRGFEKPLDVWLDNIKAFVEIRIDADAEKWQAELMEKAYPPHAQLFFINLDWFYLALCTPANPQDEFIMTENGYGVSEGPVSLFTNPVTKQTRGLYTEFHIFAHISPKLSMVLRSQCLPLPSEDAIESIKSMRESMHRLVVTPHNLPEGQSSFLQDLPVTKARNSYTKLTNGIISNSKDEPLVLGPDDKFYFKFFPISTALMNKINFVFLEEAWSTSTIVFNRKSAMLRAIEAYLTLDNGKGWKEVKGEDDPRLSYLRKLEEASELLGRKIKAKYSLNQGPEMKFTESSVISGKDQVFELVDASPAAKRIYNKLRNLTWESPAESTLDALDREDFVVAASMLKLRIKIDTWTRGLDEEVRERSRDELRDLYCERPAQQVWIYMKRIRFMKNGGTVIGPDGKIVDSNLQAKILPGPEDTIAYMAEMFVPPHHCRMMFYATLNAIKLANPEFGLTKEFTLDAEGARRLRQEKDLSLGSQGSICDCGIADFEVAARTFRDAVKSEGPADWFSASPLLQKILTSEETIEIQTRLGVEQMLRSLMRPELSNNPMSRLLDVLFRVVFPPFGFKRNWTDEVLPQASEFKDLHSELEALRLETSSEEKSAAGNNCDL